MREKLIFNKLKGHIGHELSCLGDASEKVILFCTTCNHILVDIGKDKPQKKKKAFNMNKYKTFEEGSKGSPDQWRKAAEQIFSINSENCLQTLGLSGVPASKDALKLHYRSMIRKVHPDAGGSEDEASRLNAAYDFAMELFFPAGNTPASTSKERRDTGLRAQLLNPITEEEAIRYLNDDDYCISEKKDGKHILVETGKNMAIANKQGLETTLPQTIAKALADMPGMILDGEEIKGVYHVFDILKIGDEDLRRQSYRQRYARLCDLRSVISDQKHLKIVPCIFGTKSKMEFFLKMKSEQREGVVFKKLDAKFAEGRPAAGGDFLKCKFWASLSAIVSEQSTGKSSFISYVFDLQEKKVSMGHCSTLGKKEPKPGDIVEIRYLYAGKEGKLIQPVMLGIRDDVSADECTTKQLKFKRDD